tara:strand:+ start:836 stop:1144 length:309 start_codon:yes stop_codon:yes gene_type:complete
MAIQAIIPFIPLITKLIDHGFSKDKKVTEQAVDIIKNSSGKTEIAQSGYIYTLYSIYHSIIGCGEELTLASFSCVSLDQWVMLSGFISMAYVTLRGKIKEAK